jgi:integrase
MPRKIPPLTASQVKQAKPKDKEYNLPDGDGLMLRIKPIGSKTWVFNYYRPFTKKRANIGLGIYPEVSLAKAREERAKIRALVKSNIDPKTHKDKHQRQQVELLTNTFTEVAKTWFEIKSPKVQPKTGQRIWNSINTYLIPALGNYPVAELTAPIVIKVIKPIEANSTEIARRLCQRINEVMTFAVNTGLIITNPLAGIKDAFGTTITKHNPTILPEELPKLMDDINYSGMNRVTRCLVEWQLHTMARSAVCACAKWDEIDFKNKQWVIPASKMKMKREHTIPLSEQSLEILERLKPISGHWEYIFPAHKRLSGHINSEAVNNALKRMGYKNKLTAHGMRSLASTTLNEQGFDFDVVEMALAHVEKNQTRKAYNHAEYLERRRVMMAWWSEHIEHSQNGTVQSKNIINLKAKYV